MPCYHPVKGYISYNGDKRKFVPSKLTPPGETKMEVPCGQCYGCRLERSRQWATRLIKEEKDHLHSCFITLTYSEENLPKYGNLQPQHFTKFIKALRQEFAYKYKDPNTNRWKKIYHKFKYFHCGEYGEQKSRPHYHAILFNINFEDKKLWKRTKSGELIYRSEMLESLWPHGHSSIGTVTFESAAYVARYVMKKITGDKADQHYKIITDINKDTGEILNSIQLQQEYVTMSRNPGIGNTHYDKYKTDMFPSDQISLYRNGETKHAKPPRFYTDKLKNDNPIMHKQLKEKRITASQIMTDKGEYTRIRLATKEKIKLAQTKNLHRHFEEFH